MCVEYMKKFRCLRKSFTLLPLTQDFSEHLEFFFVVTLHNQHYVFSHHRSRICPPCVLSLLR